MCPKLVLSIDKPKKLVHLNWEKVFVYFLKWTKEATNSLKQTFNLGKSDWGGYYFIEKIETNSTNHTLT